MIVAIVGGGLSGASIARAVSERGAAPRLLSRSTGFDVLNDDPATALAGVDAVIEATGYFTLSRTRARRFYVGSTTAIGIAASALRTRHVLLSIVGCDLPDLQGYGVFAAKAEQERVARALSADVTVVRSTQWFEFAQQNASRFGVGPLVFVPSMTIQPIALDAVAGVLANAALDGRLDPLVQISGPERTTLQRMTQRLLKGTGKIPVPAPLPGRYGAGFRDGRLLPNGTAEVHGPTFDTWRHSRP